MALAAASRRLLVNRINPALLATLQHYTWLHSSAEGLSNPGAQLYYEEVHAAAQGGHGGSGGGPPKTAIVLHGLLGSGRYGISWAYALSHRQLGQTAWNKLARLISLPYPRFWPPFQELEGHDL
jgi:hypothetical protein